MNRRRNNYLGNGVCSYKIQAGIIHSSHISTTYLLFVVICFLVSNSPGCPCTT